MKKTTSLIAVMGILFLFLFPLIVFAQAGGPSKPKPSSGGEVRLVNPLEKQGINSVEDLIPKLLAIVVQVGVIVCTFFIMYAGFLYVSARGDENAIKKAHSIFTWAVIGTMVLLGAQIISSVLGNTVKNVLGK